MTALSSLIFPNSRVLAGWWKLLVPLRLQALWVGHLILHRVEALVAVERPQQLDPLPHFVLKALALTSDASLEAMNQRLHLGHPLLRQVLGSLKKNGLAGSGPSKTWTLSPLARQGLDQGVYQRTAPERRAFYFVESEQAGRLPHFVSLQDHPAVSNWQPPKSWQFEPSQLEACVRQSTKWKQRHGFPLDVTAILGFHPGETAAASAPQPWEQIIIDRPVRLVAAMALVSAGEEDERLLGFAVQEDGWSLFAKEPVFSLRRNWQEIFLELATEPGLDQWRQAWGTWCRPRNLPPADVDACTIERQGCSVHITAPRRLVERLRAARSDALKGEAWLCAGTRRVRMVARVVMS